MVEELYDDKVDDYSEDEENTDFRFSITSYGADYTVDRLVSRLRDNKIVIPEFQRQYVWDIKQASRFIESLILGLPVPGVFFTQEKGTNKMLVIDGQQRLLSLQKFYDKKFGSQLFKLKNVQDDLEGKTIDDLSTNDKNMLDDSVIHATVVKQDSPTDDDSSIYMVFERLNTGGTKLAPQEIRACIYHGELNKCLSELAENDTWKQIYAADNKRLKSQELILRYFALLENYKEYTRGLKGFLNNYMEANKNPGEKKIAWLSQKFITTIETSYKIAGSNAFRIGKNINAAIFDSVMIALTIYSDSVPNIDYDHLSKAYRALLADAEYLSYVESTTASQASVLGRIDRAIHFFCNGQINQRGL